MSADLDVALRDALPWLKKRRDHLLHEIERGYNVIGAIAQDPWKDMADHMNIDGWKVAIPEYTAEAQSLATLIERAGQ